MNYFEQILLQTSGPVQYELTPTRNIRMVQHPYPYSIKEEELVNKIQSMLICDIDGNPIDNLPPGVKRINNRMTLLGPYSAIIKCGFVP